MRSLILSSILFSSITLCSLNAVADDNVNPYHPIMPDLHPVRYGFSVDLGVPSGVAAGFVVHPKVDWLSLDAALTYNALAPGARLSARLDPMALLPRLPVGVFADVQGGFAAQGNIPGHTDLPRVGYDYANFFGGLRLGRANGFNWSFEFGPSFLHFNTANFQTVASKSGLSGLTLSNPTANGWFVPAFQTGMQYVF